MWRRNLECEQILLAQRIQLRLRELEFIRWQINLNLPEAIRQLHVGQATLLRPQSRAQEMVVADRCVLVIVDIEFHLGVPAPLHDHVIAKDEIVWHVHREITIRLDERVHVIQVIVGEVAEAVPLFVADHLRKIEKVGNVPQAKQVFGDLRARGNTDAQRHQACKCGSFNLSMFSVVKFGLRFNNISCNRAVLSCLKLVTSLGKMSLGTWPWSTRSKIPRFINLTTTGKIDFRGPENSFITYTRSALSSRSNVPRKSPTNCRCSFSNVRLPFEGGVTATPCECARLGAGMSANRPKPNLPPTETA